MTVGPLLFLLSLKNVKNETCSSIFLKKHPATSASIGGKKKICI